MDDHLYRTRMHIIDGLLVIQSINETQHEFL